MLAVAAASLRAVVSPDERKKIVEEWARERLREMTRDRRGAAAKLAQKLGISSAHMTNMTKDPPARGVGEDVLRKLVAEWGYASRDDLVAAALAASAPARARTTTLDARYSDLEWAIRALIDEGQWTEAQVRVGAARLTVGDKGAPEGKAALFDAIKAQLRDHHRVVPKSLDRPDTTGDELAEGRSGRRKAKR